MVVMAVGDVLVLNFFWMVRDEGSWLDIGTTISHFVIGSVFSVFVACLEGVSEILIAGVDVTETVVDNVKGEHDAVKASKPANGSTTKMTTVGRGARPIID